MIKLRQQVVLVPQEPKLLGMTVAEALAYPLHLQNYSKSEIKQRIIDGTNRLHIPQTWLERTELQLSLGQRQLVGITRGLIMEPKILVLDEPTSALDTGLSEHLLTVLNILKTTIVMVNHQLDIAKKLAQRILYLEEGQLLQDSLAHQIDWGLLREKLVTAQANFTEEWL